MIGPSYSELGIDRPIDHPKAGLCRSAAAPGIPASGTRQRRAREARNTQASLAYSPPPPTREVILFVDGATAEDAAKGEQGVTGKGKAFPQSVRPYGSA